MKGSYESRLIRRELWPDLYVKTRVCSGSGSSDINLIRAMDANQKKRQIRTPAQDSWRFQKRTLVQGEEARFLVGSSKGRLAKRHNLLTFTFSLSLF